MNQPQDNLNQLEAELGTLWQQKWRYRVNIAKNREKLKTAFDEQDSKTIADKLFKFNLKMDDIRNQEQRFLKSINQHNLPGPNISDELIKDVTK